MLTVIRNASKDGLNPDDYHLGDIEQLIGKLVTSKKIEIKDTAGLDLLLTDSFLLLASHMASGKTDPETIYPEWDISRRNAVHIRENFLDSAIKSNNIAGAIQNLVPKHPEYHNLRKALSEYQRFRELGGWESCTPGLQKLQAGARHPAVSLLRRRLSVTQGFIDYDPDDEFMFDEPLKEQVILFQQQNNLKPDGVVDNATIEALNIPVNDRIETLEANLERWRWINDDLGKRYIRVNIASFKLEVIENDMPVLQSRAVVGLPYRQTPVFSSRMTYLVLNPDWMVPPSIMKKEIIPVMINDSSYLVKNDMKVVKYDGTEIAPSSIIWRIVDTASFPYMIRQEPGPLNSLGRIAFMFPNKYFVYIHDTPAPYLFVRNERAFSHGCIRIDKAVELARYLLKGNTTSDSIDIQKVIEEGKTQIIPLHSPIPVHILYMTAWADDKGTAYFTKDIYNRDRQLINALKQTPPDPRK